MMGYPVSSIEHPKTITSSMHRVPTGKPKLNFLIFPRSTNRNSLMIRRHLTLGKVLRLLVAFIDTFLHNFDIYIDGTWGGENQKFAKNPPEKTTNVVNI